MRRHIFRNPKKDIMQDVKLRDSMIEKGGVSKGDEKFFMKRVFLVITISGVL